MIPRCRGTKLCVIVLTFPWGADTADTTRPAAPSCALHDQPYDTHARTPSTRQVEWVTAATEALVGQEQGPRCEKWLQRGKSHLPRILRS